MRGVCLNPWSTGRSAWRGRQLGHNVAQRIRSSQTAARCYRHTPAPTCSSVSSMARTTATQCCGSGADSSPVARCVWGANWCWFPGVGQWAHELHGQERHAAQKCRHTANGKPFNAVSCDKSKHYRYFRFCTASRWLRWHNCSGSSAFGAMLNGYRVYAHGCCQVATGS